MGIWGKNTVGRETGGRATRYDVLKDSPLSGGQMVVREGMKRMERKREGGDRPAIYPGNPLCFLWFRNFSAYLRHMLRYLVRESWLSVPCNQISSLIKTELPRA